MLITCAYCAFKVNLLCSIMLQNFINNDSKYSKDMSYRKGDNLISIITESES